MTGKKYKITWDYLKEEKHGGSLLALKIVWSENDILCSLNICFCKNRIHFYELVSFADYMNIVSYVPLNHLHGEIKSSRVVKLH